MIYKKGQAVPRDDAEAVKWWKLSADQSYAFAQAYLGDSYRKGEGVSQDYTEAYRWYSLAAEQGLSFAQINLGIRYYKGEGITQNMQMAHMWFAIASTNGFEQAGEYRDSLSALMTNVEITESQEMARECMSSNYQSCGH